MLELLRGNRWRTFLSSMREDSAAASRGRTFSAFFGLPQKLTIDLPDPEQRFHSLSWKLHPDNFVRASEDERQLSLDRSSQLNDAYRTLRDPVARVEYLLSLSGMRKEGQKKQQAPPEIARRSV